MAVYMASVGLVRMSIIIAENTTILLVSLENYYLIMLHIYNKYSYTVILI